VNMATPTDPVRPDPYAISSDSERNPGRIPTGGLVRPDVLIPG